MKYRLFGSPQRDDTLDRARPNQFDRLFFPASFRNVRGRYNLRSAHPPDIILEYPPAGHRIVDEWHYAETRCAPSAPRTAEFSHRRHAGFPTVIAKTRAGSVMVHVTTTLRLAPTHSFLESSPTKVSQPAHREFREFFTETTST